MGNFWVIWYHFNVCPQKHQSSLIFVFYHDHHRWHQPGEVEWDVLVGFEVLALASSVLYHKPLLGGAPSYFAGVVKKTTPKTKTKTMAMTMTNTLASSVLYQYHSLCTVPLYCVRDMRGIRVTSFMTRRIQVNHFNCRAYQGCNFSSIFTLFLSFYISRQISISGWPHLSSWASGHLRVEKWSEN